jgi:hypothetical protein
MNKLLIITPPDKIFNKTPSCLLIKPGMELKNQFQAIASDIIDDLNLFVFDDNETDIDWMLCIANLADTVIIDVDNCDTITRNFVSFLLSHPHVYYITTDETIPYGLISKNRVYDLQWFIHSLQNSPIE